MIIYAQISYKTYIHATMPFLICRKTAYLERIEKSLPEPAPWRLSHLTVEIFSPLHFCWCQTEGAAQTAEGEEVEAVEVEL